MIMRYAHVSQYPNVFLAMSGLRVAEYDAWLREVLPLYRQAEQARLARPNRQREPGGGRD
jgi:hypothetical protein